jgi:uncharacterized protein (DUF2249 family)
LWDNRGAMRVFLKSRRDGRKSCEGGIAMAYPQYVMERETILRLLDEGKTIEFISDKRPLNLVYREIWTLVKKSPKKVRIRYYRNGELLLDDIRSLDEHGLGNMLQSGVRWRIADDEA